MNDQLFVKANDSSPGGLPAKRSVAVWAILVFLIYTNIAFAFEEESGRYHIVYAADNELCTDLVTLINFDIERYGLVRYEAHDGFLQWGSEGPLKERRRRPEDPVPWAMIDVDNDGKNEIIYKARSYFRSVPSETIYVRQENIDDLEFQKPAQPHTIGIELQERINFGDFSHPLKYAPSYKEYQYGTGPIIRTPNVGRGQYRLNIFQREYVSFLAVDPIRAREGDWFVILKYKGNSLYEDVCYFQFEGKHPELRN